MKRVVIIFERSVRIFFLKSSGEKIGKTRFGKRGHVKNGERLTRGSVKIQRAHTDSFS